MSALVLHRDPDCTGTWELRETLVLRRDVYRCTRCGVQHRASEDIAFVACSENEAGRTAAELTAKGKALVNVRLTPSLPRRRRTR